MSKTYLKISQLEAITVPGACYIGQMMVAPNAPVSYWYLVLAGVALLSAPIGKAICGTTGCTWMPAWLVTAFADVQYYEQEIGLSGQVRANVLMIASGLIYPLALSNGKLDDLISFDFYKNNFMYIIAGILLGAAGGYAARWIWASSINKDSN